MDLWLPRNITSYGKIKLLVFKSLKLSKITHKSKGKSKQSILENVKKLDGLQLTYILLFDKALKLSWLRRIYNQTGVGYLFHTAITLIQHFMVVLTLKTLNKISKMLFGLIL